MTEEIVQQVTLSASREASYYADDFLVSRVEAFFNSKRVQFFRWSSSSNSDANASFVLTRDEVKTFLEAYRSYIQAQEAEVPSDTSSDDDGLGDLDDHPF